MIHPETKRTFRQFAALTGMFGGPLEPRVRSIRESFPTRP